MRVSEEHRERAIDILDRLCRQLATVDATVIVKHERSDEHSPIRSYVKLKDELIQFHLSEKIKTVKIEPSPEERRSRLLWWDRTAYHPTGMLALRFVGLQGTGARQNWLDSSSRRIEESLKEIPEELLRAEILLRQRREEQERQHRIWQEKQRLAAERQREAARQQAFIEQALQMKREWKASQELRDFILAAEQAVPEADRDEAFKEWLLLVKWYADHIDPLLTPECAKKKLTVPNRQEWTTDALLGLERATGYGYRRW